MSMYSQFKQQDGLYESCVCCPWFEYFGDSEPGSCHYKRTNEEGYVVDYGDPHACKNIQEWIREEVEFEEKLAKGEIVLPESW